MTTAAGLDGVRLHDLRHSFASFGAGASLGLPIIGKLLGHSQAATTHRYAHLDADPLRRAAETIGATISAAMGGNEGAPVVPFKKLGGKMLDITNCPAAPTGAEKARHVWDAANIPRAEPLDEEKARRLDAAIKKAAEWHAIASTPRPLRERERLKRIAATALKLSRLLAEDAATADSIERCWPIPIGPDYFPGMRRKIDLLCCAAIDAQKHKGGGKVLRDMFGSADRLYISRLCDAYLGISDRTPAISLDPDTKVICGPFVRFVEEVATQYGFAAPARETIKTAVEKWRARKA